MRRILRNPERFGAIDLFDAVGRKYGFSLKDKASVEKFLSSLSSSLGRDRSNPIVIHGRRAENMFGFVAASLGRCAAIKQEDAGEFYGLATDIIIPDWRLVMREGAQMFVEVKNHYQRNPRENLTLAEGYCRSLLRYGEVFSLPVFLATYWVRWNIWTLTRLVDVPTDGSTRRLSLDRALVMNEMSAIGDLSIGTRAPLVMRVIPDPASPRSLATDGNASFTIHEVQFLSRDRVIAEGHERTIAFYLMLYGKWNTDDPAAVMDGSQLKAVDFVCAPREPTTTDQDFEFVGELSGMISRRFDELTTTDGDVERLAPNVEPGSLGMLLERSYRGKDLPLWIFEMKPGDPKPNAGTKAGGVRDGDNTERKDASE